jgi:hypothetical protein
MKNGDRSRRKPLKELESQVPDWRRQDLAFTPHVQKFFAFIVSCETFDHLPPTCALHGVNAEASNLCNALSDKRLCKYMRYNVTHIPDCSYVEFEEGQSSIIRGQKCVTYVLIHNIPPHLDQGLYRLRQKVSRDSIVFVFILSHGCRISRGKRNVSSCKCGSCSQ